MNHPGNRKTDVSLLRKAADDAVITLLYRSAVACVLGLMLFVGNRFINQLDANTVALSAISTQVTATVAILDGVIRRVDGLEHRVNSK